MYGRVEVTARNFQQGSNRSRAEEERLRRREEYKKRERERVEIKLRQQKLARQAFVARERGRQMEEILIQLDEITRPAGEDGLFSGIVLEEER